MTLSIDDQRRIWRGLMRHWSVTHEEAPLKAEILTTVEETAAWIEANQADYNGSLTYAGSFTAIQKTLIFCAVALANVGIDFLRRVLGEVD